MSDQEFTETVRLPWKYPIGLLLFVQIVGALRNDRASMIPELSAKSGRVN